ncbi:MAG: DUF4837 family protein [Gemmatimonadetes bacterium]|nr:DUF4837 family protein [Gemmatimonadota bacterium]NNF14028.1 DUF4837 family protein [Gemmatimonadota bacterium]
MIIRTLRIGTLSLLLTMVGSACNEVPMAYGDANSVIAVMSADDWAEASDSVYGAIERRITTVRDEKTFTVTYQEPLAEYWDRLRRFRQMLVVGSRSDSWVQDALDRAREPITENGIHQVYDVWSRGQAVTLVLLDEGWDVADLDPYLTEVSTLLDSQFRRYAQNRMYFSGLDSALTDTLTMQAGFSMELPDVYEWGARDSIYLFRNDNPDPAELIRQVGVTWRTPAIDIPDQEGVLAWRAETLEPEYNFPQAVILENAEERSFDFQGNPAYELQAQWRNPPDVRWPAGGPMFTRVVTCASQDRTYLLDAWLYAPGKEKYEYLIQLETLLDSFRCDS